jgi:GTPase SAR1 family protein
MNEQKDIFQIAVVGHTNAGKTSLMRTLARDAEFGEVSPSPATTREVTSIALLADGRARADFRDTPGLEDSIGLLELVDRMRTDRRDDGPSLIERFLGSSEAAGRFSQEAKSLRQARIADLVLYVIDARDRVLPRYLDEIELLSRCGRPLLPVMNFVSDDFNRAEEWRDALARLGLHAAAAFDTVLFDADDERRLFEAMRILAEPHREAIDALIEDRSQRRRRSISRAAHAIAELLVDAAAFVVPVEPTDDKEEPNTERHRILEAEERLQAALRKQERFSHRAILAAFEFTDEDTESALLECTEGRLGIDLFSSEALKQSGVGATAGAAGGAATGAVIDLALGGMSLGAAAGIGAVVGGLLGSTAGQGKRLFRRLRGGDELRAGNATLQVLLARSLDLARGMCTRGHAATARISIKELVLKDDFLKDALALLARARNHPSWSRVERDGSESAGRTALIKRLARMVRTRIEA